MSYKSDDKLNALIKLAFEDSTIKEGIRNTSLTSARLTNEIKENADEVWSHEANRIAEYDARETALARKEKELADKLPPEPPELYNWEDKPLWALAVGLPILITVGVLYGLLWLFFESTLVWLLGYTSVKIGLYVLAGVSILLCLYYVRYQLKARRLARREQERDKWRSDKAEAEKISGIKEDRERLASLEPSIDGELLSNVIKDRLRLFIDRHIEPSYDTTLTVDEAPGLAEMIDPARTVDDVGQYGKMAAGHATGAGVGLSFQARRWYSI